MPVTLLHWVTLAMQGPLLLLPCLMPLLAHSVHHLGIPALCPEKAATTGGHTSEVNATVPAICDLSNYLPFGRSTTQGSVIAIAKDALQSS